MLSWVKVMEYFILLNIFKSHPQMTNIDIKVLNGLYVSKINLVTISL